KQVTEEKQQANANAARAIAQRERAESNLDWSLNVTRDVLFRLDGEDLSELPAVPGIRRRLTEHAVRLLQKHLDERNADPTVRQDTARIYNAVASLHSGQGDHDEACAIREKASATLEALTIECSDNPEIWMQLGHSLAALGYEFELLGLRPKAAEAHRR